MNKIYSELSRIQQELKAPKNLYNSFGKYKYRNAEGILESVKPLLNGLSLIINDELTYIGNRYYIKATVTLTNGEESVSATAYAREDETKKGMDGCQITGACSSYARKYALNALLMIDDSKDSDDDSLSPKNPANKEEKFENDTIPDGRDDIAESKTLPDTAKTITPEVQFLATAMKGLRELREISAEENKKLFKAQHEALISAGMAPAKDIKLYNLDELKDLIDAMYKNFTPNGTELKVG